MLSDKEGYMKKSVVIVSGFSGSGKGTLVWKLLEIEKLVMNGESKIWLSKSDTTRDSRLSGGDYYTYITPKEFFERISDGYYLEHNIYGNNGYGTPAELVESMLECGNTVILEIDHNGMKQAVEYFKNRDVAVTTVFICTNADSLKNRLIKRGDSDSEIKKRLLVAYNEASHIKDYDYVLINDEIEATSIRLWAIVSGVPVPRNQSFDAIQFCNRIEEILIAYNETSGGDN